MSPGFTAAVCEGFYGSLAELLCLDMPEEARSILLDLRERTGIVIDALTAESTEAIQHEKERSII